MGPQNATDFYHMMRNQWSSSAELEIIRIRKLKRLIEHAYRTVPFYRNLFLTIGLSPNDIRTVTDLTRIPVISSRDFRKISQKEVISNKVKLEKCVTVSTSGTMGSPLKIYFTKKDYTIINLSWVTPLLANSVKFFDRRAVLATPHILSGKKWYQYIGLWRSVEISLFESPDSWIGRLRVYKPDVIHGYSMSLKLLAKTIKERNIRDITPRVVFGALELVDDECRKLVSDFFQTRLVDLYGATETGCIAWECPICSNYHLNRDTVIVEFIRKEEKVSRDSQYKVVVTNLHSFAMPIIRYELDDIAIPIDKKALCGRGLPSMKIILGRSDDFTTLSSGKLLSSLVFFAIMMEVIGVN